MVAKSETPATTKRNPNSLDITPTEEDAADRLARAVIEPVTLGAVTMRAYKAPFGEVDLMGLVKAAKEQVEALHNGDMNRTEAVLIVQAHTLDTIFNELARRAINSETMPKLETYLRLGLKAQAQCRATLETLAEIKNPQPTAFIKQQNIGFNQQVNNGSLPRAHEKTKKQPNELINERINHGSTLDNGRTGATIGANTHMEAVGAFHRG